MMIGMMSDTHGRHLIAGKAIDLLTSLGCEFIIHCGDVGENVIQLLPIGKSAFVFGNNDYDKSYMRRLANELNITCLETGGVIELHDKRIGVTHGDDPSTLNALLADSSINYVLTGHTHVAHDLRVGKVRHINPGALCRASRKSVAVLNLSSDVLTHQELKD